MMKSIDVSQAIGMILGQDLTRVVPGETSGVAFKKGHIIKEEDIALMRSMGKNNVYVMEIDDDLVGPINHVIVRDDEPFSAVDHEP